MIIKIITAVSIFAATAINNGFEIVVQAVVFVNTSAFLVTVTAAVAIVFLLVLDAAMLLVLCRKRRRWRWCLLPFLS